MPGIGEEKLDLAFEHVERVGVVGVGMRVDALEVWVVGELERLDLRQLGKDTMAPRADSLTLAVRDEERLFHVSRS